jgi:hypothetical protein
MRDATQVVVEQLEQGIDRAAIVGARAIHQDGSVARLRQSFASEQVRCIPDRGRRADLNAKPAAEARDAVREPTADADPAPYASGAPQPMNAAGVVFRQRLWPGMNLAKSPITFCIDSNALPPEETTP